MRLTVPVHGQERYRDVDHERRGREDLRLHPKSPWFSALGHP
jgi:hypothetical protein